MAVVVAAGSSTALVILIAAVVVVVGSESAYWLPVAAGSWLVVVAIFVVFGLDHRLFAYCSDLRPLTSSERKRLQTPLHKVAGQAGVSVNSLSLRVDPETGIGALVYGPSTLTISVGALRLPDPYLCSLLAHEFGHLRQGLGLALRLVYAFASIYLLGTIAFRWMAKHSRPVVDHPIYWALAFVVGSVFVPLALPVGVASILVRLVQRSFEYDADVSAARLGYRRELVELLDEASAQEATAEREWIGPIPLLAQHPHPRRRLRRLEALVAA